MFDNPIVSEKLRLNEKRTKRNIVTSIGFPREGIPLPGSDCYY